MKFPFGKSKFFKPDIFLANIKLSLKNVYMHDKIGDLDYRIQFDMHCWTSSHSNYTVVTKTEYENGPEFHKCLH